jgi:dolichol-phosphate mannosyltransferase
LDDNLPAEYEFEINFVNDESVDGTLKVLQQVTFREKKIGYLSFSRNFGHHNALKAVLDIAGVKVSLPWTSICNIRRS